MDIKTRRKLKDLNINEFHLYMKFMSFTGLTGEVIKLEKLHSDINSIRDPDFIITILWEDGMVSHTTYEMDCEIEHIIPEEPINYYPNKK